MIIADLFSGCGGAGVGYAQAGWEVVGFDRAPQPEYPLDFRQIDVLDLSWEDLAGFDAIHASPPCQAYSRLRNYGYDGHDVHEDYLEYTRGLLKATGLPYVIENVPGAPLHKPMTLCGSSFGLGVRRHRWFEMNWPCPGTRCRHKLQPEHMAVYGHFSGGLEAAREAMGMPWAPRYGITQAIPPAYTQYVGTQLRLFLEHEQDLHGRSL